MMGAGARLGAAAAVVVLWTTAVAGVVGGGGGGGDAPAALLDQESSSASADELRAYFSRLVRRDSPEPPWARTIAQHAKRDAVQTALRASLARQQSGPAGHRASARPFDDGAWRRVFREAQAARRAEAVYRQVEKAQRKIIEAAAEFTLPPRKKALLHAAAARKRAQPRSTVQREEDAELHALEARCADGLDERACRHLARTAQASVQARTHAWLRASHRARVAAAHRNPPAQPAAIAAAPESGVAKAAHASSLWATALPVGSRRARRDEADTQKGAARARLARLYDHQARLAKESALVEDHEADSEEAVAAAQERTAHQCLGGSIAACRQLQHGHRQGGVRKGELGAGMASAGSDGEGGASVRAIETAGRIMDGVAACVENADASECAATRVAAEMQQKIAALERAHRVHRTRLDDGRPHPHRVPARPPDAQTPRAAPHPETPVGGDVRGLAQDSAEDAKDSPVVSSSLEPSTTTTSSSSPPPALRAAPAHSAVRGRGRLHAHAHEQDGLASQGLRGGLGAAWRFLAKLLP